MRVREPAYRSRTHAAAGARQNLVVRPSSPLRALSVTLALLSLMNLAAGNMASAQSASAFTSADSIHAPNSAVSAALAQLARQPSPENRMQLQAALQSGELFLAVRPASRNSLEYRALEHATEVSLLTTMTPMGESALVAFTDLEELKSRAPQASGYVIELSVEVLRMVVREGFAALVLNPAGNWAELPRSEVAKILGITE